MSRKREEAPEIQEDAAETALDATLRPHEWGEYVGQTQVKENLRILLTAARERNQPPEHLLFYGPPGLGKTTLAHLIARELGSGFRATSGPAIEKVGDLAAILTNLSPRDVLFIDEIHRLPRTIEEVLYPAMESGVLDIVLGKGPSARTIQLELPPFTLVAATTKMASLSSPLRSRFSGGVFRLEYYAPKEIEEILTRSAKLLGISANAKAIGEIAKRSRATPRTANFLLKRCRDFAQVEKTSFSEDTVEKALTLLGVDTLGLMEADRALLTALIEKFGGGPAGLSTLAAAIGEEQPTVEDVLEPYLIQCGLIERSPRGRVATARAHEHLSARGRGQLPF